MCQTLSYKFTLQFAARKGCGLMPDYKTQHQWYGAFIHGHRL